MITSTNSKPRKRRKPMTLAEFKVEEITRKRREAAERKKLDHLSPELRERAGQFADKIEAAVNAQAGRHLIQLYDPNYYSPERLAITTDEERHAMSLSFVGDTPPTSVDCRGDVPRAVAAKLREHAELYLRAAELVDGMGG